MTLKVVASSLPPDIIASPIMLEVHLADVQRSNRVARPCARISASPSVSFTLAASCRSKQHAKYRQPLDRLMDRSICGEGAVVPPQTLAANRTVDQPRWRISATRPCPRLAKS